MKISISPYIILRLTIAFLLPVALSAQQASYTFLISGSQSTSNNEATGSAGWAKATLFGNTLSYRAYYEGFTSLNAAHFHGPAGDGETAGVQVGIASGNRPSPITGFATLTNEQVAQLQAGNWYLNFHTPQSPGGEIRGQVVPQLDFQPTTLLSGAQQPDAVESLGAGAARVEFNPVTNELSWTVVYEGLDSGVTGMHFHGPAEPGTNAGVKVNIGGTSGLQSGTQGSVILTDPDNIEDLLDGLWYINIHTNNYAGGEIRGQVIPVVLETSTFNFLLSGAQATTNNEATGSAGWASVSLTGNHVEYSVFHEGLSSLNAAHFHGPAAPGTNAGVVVGIPAGSSPIEGSADLSDEQVAELLAGYYYINLHTPESPGGELRGQVVPQLPLQPTTLLSGFQQSQTVDSLAAGAARVEFNTVTNELSWKVVYEGFDSGVTGMHFHGPAGPGTNAGVKVNIGGTSGLQSGTEGSVVLTNQNDINDLLNGLWYLNIHSSDHTGGEIRGQVYPDIFPKYVLPWVTAGPGEVIVSPWFGSFEANASGWLKHADLNWIYIGAVQTPSSMWIYSLYREAWLWSAAGFWPIVYDSGTGDWIYYFIVPDLGAWVYNYSTAAWSFNP